MLYVFLVVLSVVWATRFEGTHHLDGTTEHRTLIGPGPLVAITTREPESARSTKVAWTLLALFVVACYPIARGIAYGFERAVRGSLPLVRWLLLGAATVPVLALGAALGWSRYYWGYFVARPSTAEAVGGIATIEGISVVGCDLSPGPPRCELWPRRSVAEAVDYCRSDPYECLDGRIAVGLEDAGLLPGRAHPIDVAALRRVEAVLADARFLASSEPGYDGNKRLGGIVASGRSATGQPLLAVGLEGGQVSDDHYPYYELRVSTEGSMPRVVRRSVFFHDVAGIEGFEWREAFIAANVIGLTAWVPVCLLTGAMVGVRRRRLVGA